MTLTRTAPIRKKRPGKRRTTHQTEHLREVSRYRFDAK